jgi:hypothetical protein
MTVRAREPRTNKYWPVLLLDTAAIAILVFLALTPHASLWWGVLAVLWICMAALRARIEYKSR